MCLSLIESMLQFYVCSKYYGIQHTVKQAYNEVSMMGNFASLHV